MSMKRLIILSALPGSGKSTWAKEYKRTHENVYIISSDALRYEVTGTTDDFSKQDIVWELFSKRIREYANIGYDVDVILDALCDLNYLREKYVKENPEYDEYYLVLFPRTIEHIKFYNKQRNKTSWVPDDVLEKLIAKWEEPTEQIKALFDKILIIN